MVRAIFVTCTVGFVASICLRSDAQKKANPSPDGQAMAGTPYGDYTIGNPVSFENLSIFLITSRTLKNQDRYTTLDEGLAAGSVKVVEVGAASPNPFGNDVPQSNRQSSSPSEHANQRATSSSNSDDLFGSGDVDGDVNKLLIENKSGKPLYLMPGEVISGGKQDRTIGQEMVIDSDAKAVPVDVFCVEHGRWAGRGLEATTSQVGSADFNRSQSLVVSQTATVEQLAKESQSGKFIAGVGQLNKDARVAVQQSKNQSKVWDEVAKTNAKVGNKSQTANFAENYFAGDTAKDLEPFIEKLKPAGETKQIVGVAVAVNGKMLSVDIFESTPLFKKFWPKLLKSYALDAIAASSERQKKKLKSITPDDCIAFLKQVENSKAESVPAARGQKLVKRDTPGAISFSYYDVKAAHSGAGGGFGGSVHTSVLSK